MSDVGDSNNHKRSKSAAALSLLRRKDTRDDESGSEDGRLSATGSHASPPKSSAPRSHVSRLSTPSAVLSRTPSNNQAAANAKASPTQETKTSSLEQSIRKFRVVEALRSGDTASISKVIRETADGLPRASTSSLSGASAAGALEDTTILHLAMQCAEFPVIEYVLSDGLGSLDVNARDKDGNTPLHVAAMHSRTQAVKLLLEQKEINDAIANSQGKLPIDLARNPEIFQLLQLSRSLFTDTKVQQVQDLIAKGDYETLAQVLEEARLKTMLDINSTEFVLDPAVVQAGGTLLHEAARKKNIQLIQVLLLHGADPFRRDRRGKLPQSITNDDNVKAVLKKSPAAVAAQRGIQEKAVLGHAASQNAAAGGPSDPLAGREAREMKGYLKKWTNYRKGYQLRWFVLEDGVLSYYKHQDDAGSACRGAINMKIAKLHMSPDEKTKFEIIGKSSVKYTLKANHEVEAKRWFWALNNSIQWTKDQAREEERQAARNAELLRQAKADQSGSLSIQESHSENTSMTDLRRVSTQPQARPILAVKKSDMTGTSLAESVEEEDFVDTFTEADGHGAGPSTAPGDQDDDDDYGEDTSGREPQATKDALNITAQSAKLQLETMASVHSALLNEISLRPATPISDVQVAQALSTYDAAIRSLTGLIGDLLRISKDRDAFWQYRLDRESDMRRMWEESMAQVAREQEILEARVGESEMKRKLAKKALREVMEGGGLPSASVTPTIEKVQEEVDEAVAIVKASNKNLARKQTALEQMVEMSDSESGLEDEFFDAIDAGDVEVTELPHIKAMQEKEEVASSRLDISSSFTGYENGIRHKLKLDSDNRPKISLFGQGIIKSMIGKDLTRFALPVSFNEPTSLLHRCGEDMEYADLLDLASERADSIERLMYVAAFAASEYASTIGRVAKPFNPLLGETFEYVRPDKGYRFFVEQIEHHPPTGAAWAEAPNWTYWGTSKVQPSFTGTSIDVRPLGTWFLKLRPTAGGKEDFFTWKKVTSSVIGILTGNPTVDNYGLMEIKNWTTGEVASVNFVERTWRASSAYRIVGKVMDASGQVRMSLGGRWNSKIYARLTPGYEAAVGEPSTSNGDVVHRGSIADPSRAYLIWQANERPKGIPFNLTPFVLTFNHIDDNLRQWIAPTDSRLRPDQRAMEEGQYDLAASEKNRLEENQRARRRVREMAPKEEDKLFISKWFQKVTCEISGEEYWKFNGNYWTQREKAGPDGDYAAAWAGLEPIYDDIPA
ncbi:hypothetical protein TRIATDRAFT_88852 [Trichoderma atroviride IMI 206040]|uniref:PH domain-containing protein n=1 Tax=Hypocrea atroviridis (strain ATCC 20476 / IMI 206040) TaxID=452589 RepID=G9NUM3_HYPAI|nr:uncharacterized protein TRIATDRAFT_88852 [Trichoderma atroviride IMI 206040]EHK45749.1 hypothetical protein TRIATDRAFT_88852 [Trichoderma atroviride IMI 206040]